jgi:ABC transporter substrate binding protein
MKRREFLTAFCGVVAVWPLSARAQQTSETVPKVGFVYPGSKEVAASRIDAIMSGLRVSGYAPPVQVELVARTADGDPARIAPLVEELIGKNVNVIIANGPPVLHIARAATRTIPIVALDLETDPVASGVAASLGRPGSNVTGVFLDFPDFTTKWIELLRESNPKLSRMAVLWDPVTGPVQVESVKKVAGSLNIQLVTLEVRRPSDFEEAFLGRHSTQSRRDGDVVVSLDLGKCPDVGRIFSSSSPPSNYAFPRLRPERRAYGLRAKFARVVSARRRACWQRVEGSKSGRFANRTTDQIRAGSQPTNRERSRPIHSCVAFVTCRRSDRVAHNVRFWPIADIPSCSSTCPLSGVKRTLSVAVQMSAYDPKRT